MYAPLSYLLYKHCETWGLQNQPILFFKDSLEEVCVAMLGMFAIASLSWLHLRWISKLYHVEVQWLRSPSPSNILIVVNPTTKSQR